MKWTNDDVKLVEKLVEIKNKGLYASGAEVTEIYNRVLEKKVNPTNCGSCIRGRIQELENALNRFKQKLELNTPSEPKQENTEPLNEPKKTGRKKKNATE